MLRILSATLLSPLWAPAYTAFFAGFAVPGQTDIGADWTLLYKASIHWTFGFMYGYIPMIVLGPLAHMVLRWRKHDSLFAYVTTWFLLSHLLWWGLINGTPVQDDLVGALTTSFLFNLAWLPAGATFWAIARPDQRDGKSSSAVNLDTARTSEIAAPARPRSAFGMRGRTPQ